MLHTLHITPYNVLCSMARDMTSWRALQCDTMIALTVHSTRTCIASYTQKHDYLLCVMTACFSIYVHVQLLKINCMKCILNDSLMLFALASTIGQHCKNLHHHSLALPDLKQMISRAPTGLAHFSFVFVSLRIPTDTELQCTIQNMVTDRSSTASKS